MTRLERKRTQRLRRNSRRNELLSELTQRHMRQRRLTFETLEDRRLLTSDAFYSAQHASMPFDLRLQVNTYGDGQELVLLDTLTGDKVASRPLLELTGVILIEGSILDDVLRIDLGLSDFQDLPGRIVFDGNQGNDILHGPHTNTTWRITGPNIGNVGGERCLQFLAVENLAGAADNNDTFIFHEAGSIRGLVEGGNGGDDSLVLADGHFQTVTFAFLDSHFGTILRDTDIITFTGLEPAVDNTGGTKIVTDPADDADGGLGSDITISGSGGAITVRAPTWPESVVFTNPGDVTINAGDGNDYIVIEPLDTYAHALTVNCGEGDDGVLVRGLPSIGRYFRINGGHGTDYANVAQLPDFKTLVIQADGQADVVSGAPPLKLVDLDFFETVVGVDAKAGRQQRDAGPIASDAVLDLLEEYATDELDGDPSAPFSLYLEDFGVGPAWAEAFKLYTQFLNNDPDLPLPTAHYSEENPEHKSLVDAFKTHPDVTRVVSQIMDLAERSIVRLKPSLSRRYELSSLVHPAAAPRYGHACNL